MPRHDSLHDAVTDDDIASFQALLSEKPQLLKTMEDGQYPLAFAAMRGKWRFVISALEYVEPADTHDHYGLGRALYEACKFIKPSIVRLLLAAKAQANFIDETLGDTPLHWAMRNGDLDSITALLQHKADPTIKSNTHLTPVAEIAATLSNKNHHRWRSIITLAQHYKTNSDEADLSLPLVLAIYKHHVAAVSALTAAGATTIGFVERKTGQTCLHYVIQHDMALFPFVIQQEHDLTHKDHQQRTVLQLAVALNNWVAIAGIANRFNTDGHDLAGYNEALWKACMFNQTDAALALIKAGANVNAQSSCGSSCLHWAVYHGNSDLVDALVAANADLCVKDLQGYEPFDEASAIAYGIEKAYRLQHLHDAIKDILLDPIQLSVFNPDELTCISPRGTTYQRESIKTWLEKNKTDPFTRELLTLDMLVRNNIIADILNYYVQPNVDISKAPPCLFYNGELMLDGVVAIDGNTYPRARLLEFLAANDNKTPTGQCQGSKKLIPNLVVQELAARFKPQLRECVKSVFAGATMFSRGTMQPAETQLRTSPPHSPNL